MKRILLLGLLVLAVAVPAQAGESWTGTILAPNPGTRVIGGVTEIGSPCLGSIDPDVPAGAAQGVDGYWIELGAVYDGAAATLTAAEPNDVDAWFYDEGCNLITPSVDANAYSMASTAQGPNGNEEGIIPVGAAFVAVDLYVGAAATFTFTIA